MLVLSSIILFEVMLSSLPCVKVKEAWRGPLRRSCDYCVKMKRACDGKTPCQLCRRREKTCTRSFRKKSGPAKGTKYAKRRSRLVIEASTGSRKRSAEAVTQSVSDDSSNKCSSKDQFRNSTEKHSTRQAVGRSKRMRRQHIWETSMATPQSGLSFHVEVKKEVQVKNDSNTDIALAAAAAVEAAQADWAVSASSTDEDTKPSTLCNQGRVEDVLFQDLLSKEELDESCLQQQLLPRPRAGAIRSWGSNNDECHDVGTATTPTSSTTSAEYDHQVDTSVKVMTGVGLQSHHQTYPLEQLHHNQERHHVEEFYPVTKDQDHCASSNHYSAAMVAPNRDIDEVGPNQHHHHHHHHHHHQQLSSAPNGHFRSRAQSSAPATTPPDSIMRLCHSSVWPSSSLRHEETAEKPEEMFHLQQNDLCHPGTHSSSPLTLQQQKDRDVLVAGSRGAVPPGGDPGGGSMDYAGGGSSGSGGGSRGSDSGGDGVGRHGGSVLGLVLELEHGYGGTNLTHSRNNLVPSP
ncbi:unnamed protein product, partial [Choristocarpus tenellus]